MLAGLPVEVGEVEEVRTSLIRKGNLIMKPKKDSPLS
jgi:hypothetical protein